MEMIRWMHPGPGRAPVPLKKDQFGSDLLAMTATELIFVQVKSGKAAATSNYPDARDVFAQFYFPPGVKKWVVAWSRGARAPRVIDMDAPTEKKQKETLF